MRFYADEGATPWTGADYELLEKLLDEGWSRLAIAREMRRSEYSVICGVNSLEARNKAIANLDRLLAQRKYKLPQGAKEHPAMALDWGTFGKPEGKARRSTDFVLNGRDYGLLFWKLDQLIKIKIALTAEFGRYK